jgi:hypothetical protein
MQPGWRATRVTKWTVQCDRMLFRLMCYIHSTLDALLQGWVGDEPSNIELCLYTDADFAGDPDNARSTTGVFLCLRGPNTFVPLGATSKRQTCVSHSTPEAEAVAADHGIRTEGLPALPLWELLLARKLRIQWWEDNSAVIQIMTTGRNPTIRYMGRTHKVDLSFLHEVASGPCCSLRHCHTDLMAADIFTKPFLVDAKWTHARMLIGVVTTGELWSGPAAKPRGARPAPAAPAPVPTPTQQKHRYTVIECCSDRKSSIGRFCPTERGCKVIRLTEEDNILSPQGRRKLFNACRYEPCPILWGSIPCTGGSAWQRINALRGAGPKIEQR